ncbi:MAG: GDSL-type esterase/lipase family protein [Clostridiales bacterium]|nr:GDSL-type esterase/lipase family protein [Clostridiales bacterium]
MQRRLAKSSHQAQAELSIVVCYGDSNTWGYDPCSPYGNRYPTGSLWCTLLGNELGIEVRNYGLNGRSIPRREREMERAMDLICHGEGFAVVMLGTNDLLGGGLLTAEDVAGRMERFLEKLCTHPLVVSGELRICLIAPPALQPGEWVREKSLLEESRRLGEAYHAVAGRLGIAFIDASGWEIPLAYDGVHFTQEGHAIFAARCAAAFRADASLI